MWGQLWLSHSASVAAALIGADGDGPEGLASCYSYRRCRYSSGLAGRAVLCSSQAGMMSASSALLEEVQAARVRDGLCVLAAARLAAMLPH